MNNRTKAKLYTGAYIAGSFIIGAAFTAVDYFFGTQIAIGIVASIVLAYMANMVYTLKLRELERGE